MNENTSIGLCNNGHYFLLNKLKCPFCQSSSITRIPYRDGDCLLCGGDGVMCPGFAYGCTTPSPIDIINLRNWDESTKRLTTHKT